MAIYTYLVKKTSSTNEDLVTSYNQVRIGTEQEISSAALKHYTNEKNEKRKKAFHANWTVMKKYELVQLKDANGRITGTEKKIVEEFKSQAPKMVTQEANENNQKKAMETLLANIDDLDILRGMAENLDIEFPKNVTKNRVKDLILEKQLENLNA